MNKKERNEWDRNNFDEISNKIKNEGKDGLSLCDFLRIRNFKLQNISRANEKNIKKKTKNAFEFVEQNKLNEAISELKKIHGVAIPTASAILAMKYPEKYCIIDIRVIKQLANKGILLSNKKDEWLLPEDNPQYTKNPEIYEEYLELMKENAKKSGKKLRDYEVELYEME